MSGRNRTEAGFTLIELLVVMAILGMLVALVAPALIGTEAKQRPKIARTQMSELGTALDMFKLDVGRYPNSQEGLQALRQNPGGLARWDGPYLKKDVPVDPWDHVYVYRSPGESGPYDLLSHGADGTSGGSDLNADVPG
ncbi:MAG: type II secretion system protein GspG [Deltaproteobacteria bacterium]|nr:type II secretion system protein GspG [Deltaproteobacteria bacterium]